MPEPVDAWWERRRASTGRPVPYPVGAYRDDWARYPVLQKQYHPDLNRGIALSQVPLAADVWLLWECDSGHRFIATPEEQRMRPGRERRRSTWCPTCSERARGRSPRALPMRPAAAVAAEAAGEPLPVAPAPKPAAPPPRRARAKPQRTLCPNTPALPVGEPFVSSCAPAPASAAEGSLRAALVERIAFDLAQNAVRLAQPFFDHLEAWPDLVLGDLRIAIEYDTTGRHGLEHVGRREAVDARKDRLLRHAGWEVIRIRTGGLAPLGPYDVEAAGVSGRLVDRVLDRMRDVRGALFVDAYLRG
ncbi:MAG TPA: hypothetical protein VIG76_11385 [Amnibacterium sp.]|jgi:hypothetical protein|uniref:hypothetical protein n=1 Tax=Amnibacterium sp. TaxID=1872496 RepID=UPI002F91FF8B